MHQISNEYSMNIIVGPAHNDFQNGFSFGLISDAISNKQVIWR
jgi:hypothetical protein